MSPAPPGGLGTMILIVLEGKSCAGATPDAVARTHARKTILNRGSSILMSSYGCTPRAVAFKHSVFRARRGAAWAATRGNTGPRFCKRLRQQIPKRSKICHGVIDRKTR